MIKLEIWLSDNEFDKLAELKSSANCDNETFNEYAERIMHHQISAAYKRLKADSRSAQLSA